MLLFNTIVGSEVFELVWFSVFCCSYFSIGNYSSNRCKKAIIVTSPFIYEIYCSHTKSNNHILKMSFNSKY